MSVEACELIRALTAFRFWLLLSVQFAISVAKPSLNVRSQIKATPVVVPPSQDFKGPDGPWSTFLVQIGTPPQVVEVQISTKSYQTIAILPGGCIATDPVTCPSDRGGLRELFDPNTSTSWEANTVVPNSTFTLNLDTNLGYDVNGLYGYDTIQLGFSGSGGPSLNKQIVAGIETKDFFIGLLGLNPRPTNFTNYNNPVPSFLTSLKEANQIPSVSWSYTAGNQYWPGNVLGSLILGGYDTGRFVPNSVTFPFNSVDERDLTVIITSIGFGRAKGPALMPSGYGIGSGANMAAFIDSTTPYFWLPLAACQAFEEAFGLSWDDSVQGYLVNDTLHTALQQQNISVTFNLATPNGTESVAITLPYGAFDLNVQYPVLANSSRYFPLMRAANETQYTLGRAFLQEAYLIADYERRVFSVNQCQNDVRFENIVAIMSVDEEGSKILHGVSRGAIIGIAIGGVTALMFLVLFGFLHKGRIKRVFHIQLRRDMNELSGDSSILSGDNNKHSDMQEIGGDKHLGHELNGVKLPRHEIDNREYPGHELSNDKSRFELDGAEQIKRELPAVEYPATEHPQSPRPAQSEAAGYSSSRASGDMR